MAWEVVIGDGKQIVLPNRFGNEQGAIIIQIGTQSEHFSFNRLLRKVGALFQ